jgi:hypothetical protein
VSRAAMLDAAVTSKKEELGDGVKRDDRSDRHRDDGFFPQLLEYFFLN